MIELNGVLPVDKPQGPTSHDVVAAARRALRLRRIGHTGTLDPFASGLLLLCLGPSTRLAEYLTALPKTYLARMQLGVATDTDDHTGEVISRNDSWKSLSEADVRSALRTQTGTLQQLPPRFSAKKVGGERMYAAARRGEELERTPVEVTVYRLELVRFDPPEVDFEVDCSSGTYIRAIARDAGDALGVGGHLSGLRRTRVGAHSIGGAIPLERLDDLDAVCSALLSPAGAVSHLPQLVIDESAANRIRHGGRLPAPDGVPEGRPIALLSSKRDLIAVAERRGVDVLPRKVLA